MSSGVALRLMDICWRYGQQPAVVENLSLEVEPGEMVALLGESGCGKTTILRLIAGLIRPASGTILVDGAVMNQVPAEKRKTALVFQKPMLFPHLPVAENVSFSLRLKGMGAAEIRERMLEALSLVRLEGLEQRRPHQLSGGQEQRVALARALVSQPRILLLDEPFAALDQNLRGEMQDLVRDVQQRLGLTSIFVTHDRTEAARMARRIAYLRGGRIVQCGSPRDFHEAPATVETARFFGFQTVRGESVSGQLTSALGSFPAGEIRDGRVWICLRPKDLVLDTDQGASARVDSSVDLGENISTTVRTPGGERIEVLHSGPIREPGQSIRIRFDTSRMHVFPREEP